MRSSRMQASIISVFENNARASMRIVLLVILSFSTTRPASPMVVAKVIRWKLKNAEKSLVYCH